MIESKKVAHLLIGKHIGDNRIIKELLGFSVENSRPDTLMWLSDKKHELFDDEFRGTLIVSDSFRQNIDTEKCSLIVVDNPRRVFQKVIKTYFAVDKNVGVENSAVISTSASIGIDNYIGHNVVIEDEVVIGNNCVILHNTVIMRKTKIGNNCQIGSNCTIGGVGFGYEKNENGSYEIIHHIGNVHIHDNVEIGNNTCIDRAVLGSTVLRNNVKVDNLVHIAHGCDIGKNSLVIANAMVAGSVIVGENVWIAPSASILNQKKVNSDAVVGMGAVVLKDVEKGDVVVGNPSKSLKKSTS